MAIILKEVPQGEMSIENMALEQLAAENTQEWAIQFVFSETEARKWVLS